LLGFGWGLGVLIQLDSEGNPHPVPGDADVRREVDDGAKMTAKGYEAAGPAGEESWAAGAPRFRPTREERGEKGAGERWARVGRIWLRADSCPPAFSYKKLIFLFITAIFCFLFPVFQKPFFFSFLF
jgi:hypothetical protein